MTYREALEDRSIAISTSDSADMLELGLSQDHLRDAMAEIAKHMLALGAKLVYGGDLRQYGFSELLFELAARYRRDTSADDKIGVTNYLAWPVHILKSLDELRDFGRSLNGTAELKLLDLEGKDIDLERRKELSTGLPNDTEWATGLSSMRRKMLQETQARIVLGGQVLKFKGSMPGIAEEALFSLRGEQPLYIVGGFGGCARDIAETMGMVDRKSRREDPWPGRESFEKFNAESLLNGLSEEENRLLARTPHIDQAVVLILRGMMKTIGTSQG